MFRKWLSAALVFALLAGGTRVANADAPPIGGVPAAQAEVLADSAEAIMWLQVVMSIVQIPLAMLSGNHDGTVSAVANAQNIINKIGEKNPHSLFAYNGQCMLNKITKQDAGPYCDYAIRLADEKISRHPAEPIYYLVKAQTQKIVGDKEGARATLLTAKDMVDPSNTKAHQQIDVELAKLDAEKE